MRRGAQESSALAERGPGRMRRIVRRLAFWRWFRFLRRLAFWRWFRFLRRLAFWRRRGGS